MSYTQNWTDDRLPLWLPFVQHLIGSENVNALEIGAFEGRSTVWMLEHILTHPTSRIVCLDPFYHNRGIDTKPTDYLVNFVDNTTSYRERVRILQAFSRDIHAETLLEFANGYDLIYIDASHWAGETVNELRLAWTVAKPGALIIFDDYGGELKDRVDEWLKPHFANGRVVELHRAYQLIIQVR